MTIKEVAEAFGVNQATIYRSALTATQREPRTRSVMKILF